MVEADPSISTISTSVGDQGRVVVANGQGSARMRSWSMSYWDVVGLGVRQLLVTSSNSFNTSNPLSQDVCACVAKSPVPFDVRRFQLRHKVRFSNSVEEFIACSESEQNDIDEDDYVLAAVDNEIETLLFESSISSDSESSSADSVGEPETQQQGLEEHITQCEVESGQDEANDNIRVNLPSAKHPRQFSFLAKDSNTEPLTETAILSIVNVTEDDEFPDTTMLRLPGMRSRLEVTRITWVREIPLSAPSHSHEYEHQERYVPPGTRLVPHQYPFTSNQPRLRAASDPFSFSSRTETANLAPFDSYIPTPTCSTPRETHENTPIKASSLRPSHGHSLSFAASERHRVPCTLMPNSAITLSPGHDATCASVAMRARSDSPLHSGSSILSPSSTLAGPSKALLDILNSSFTDTQLPSIPLPHVLPAIGLGSAQDPPVFRPKPIGSASYFRPTGHRRLSNSSAREVLHSLPAATPGTDQQAPPWPPVL